MFKSRWFFFPEAGKTFLFVYLTIDSWNFRENLIYITVPQFRACLWGRVLIYCRRARTGVEYRVFPKTEPFSFSSIAFGWFPNDLYSSTQAVYTVRGSSTESSRLHPRYSCVHADGGGGTFKYREVDLYDP